MTPARPARKHKTVKSTPLIKVYLSIQYRPSTRLFYPTFQVLAHVILVRQFCWQKGSQKGHLCRVRFCASTGTSKMLFTSQVTCASQSVSMPEYEFNLSFSKVQNAGSAGHLSTCDMCYILHMTVCNCYLP